MIVLAADHAGFHLKEAIKIFLEKKGYKITDVGAHTYKKTDDYPKYMAKAARLVSKHPGSRGILFGWSGEGEAMAANSFKNIRATVYYGGSPKIITLSREHNDANVLSIGAGFVSEKDAKRAIARWLSTKFSKAPRHVRRLTQLNRLKK